MMDKEEQDRVRVAVEEILAEADIKQVSEKQVRESASKKTGVDLSATRSGASNKMMMDQVKQQLAQAYAEEFFSTVRDKCFNKCVTKPSSGLSGGESSCISRCAERYIEATGIISRAVINSLPR